MANEIYLFHILIVAPLLIYIGYSGSKTPEMLFKLLLIFGVVIIIYHSYLYMKRTKMLDL
jgi:hypothetical protein